MEKILITGASGQLGSNLAVALKDQFDVFGLCRSNPISLEGCEFFPCDLVDEAHFSETVSSIAPDLIIHCAAMSDVDQCEMSPEEAQRQIVGVSESVAKLASEFSAKLVAISSDSVYSGESGPHTEIGSSISPVNEYGRLKLASEEAIASINPSALIFRTNFFGWAPGSRSSLAEWFMNSLRGGKTVSGYTDALFSSIYTGEMIFPILRAVSMNLAGVYNLGGGGGSKYEFGCLIADYFGFDQGLIQQATLQESRFAAPRGKDLRMDSSQLERGLGFRLPSMEQSVYSFYKDSFHREQV